MAIALPTSPGPVSAVPRMLDWGSDQSPVLGGPVQRVERLGSRHAVDFTMPPMRYVDAMAWIQRLKRGKSQRVIMEFPQPGLDLSGYGTGSITGSGSSVSISGAGGSLKEGQFFSIVQGGRRYLHSADGNGSNITITPMLRVPLSGASVEVGNPKIEGMLSGDEVSWTVDLAEIVGISFTVTEAA